MHGCYHDEVKRREWQNPEQILLDIGLKRGQTFIDVGCGSGFFSFPAAKIVGNTGIVYAVDIDKDAMRVMQKKVKEHKLNNLKLKIGKAEEIVFCDSCADFVFFGINLHDFSDPKRVLINAMKMLKTQGKLIDLDWKKEPMKIGPPMNIRFDERKAINLIRSVGFNIEMTKKLQYHYLIIAKK